jgi:hypothetical protein
MYPNKILMSSVSCPNQSLFNASTSRQILSGETVAFHAKNKWSNNITLGCEFLLLVEKYKLNNIVH